MISPERTVDAFDMLCIAAGGGALGLVAADVVAVREDADAPAEDVPSFDLAALIGSSARGSAPRRIRVAVPEAPPFDLVTDGALSVRAVARSSLVPVPPWLAPLIDSFSAELLLFEAGALVLLADPAKLAAMCAPPGARGQGAVAQAGALERSHE